MMKSQWRKDGSWRYEHIPSGIKIERYDPPNNSHFSIWVIVGKLGQFTTMRDTKIFVETHLEELTMPKKRKSPSKSTFREASKAKIVKKTRRKKGKKAAAKQIAAIAFSKAGLSRTKRGK